MKITTPTQIDPHQVAWEGALEPLGETYKAAAAQTRVTLGEPVWWPAEDAVESETGKPWSPPSSGRSYTLLRLACTLHPPMGRRARYREAVLQAYLRPRSSGAGGVVAHDLYPQHVTAEETGTVKVGLGPDLKFAGLLDLRLGEVGAEIELHHVFPIVQGYGLGESRPYWRFADHPDLPLLGCQSVYAVLAAPEAADGVRLTIELAATVETRFGLIRMALPQEAYAYVQRDIGA